MISSNLWVHNNTSNESEAKESWTWYLKHLDLPVLEDKKDDDKAANCTKYRNTQKDQSKDCKIPR